MSSLQWMHNTHSPHLYIFFQTWSLKPLQRCHYQNCHALHWCLKISCQSKIQMSWHPPVYNWQDGRLRYPMDFGLPLYVHGSTILRTWSLMKYHPFSQAFKQVKICFDWHHCTLISTSCFGLENHGANVVPIQENILIILEQCCVYPRIFSQMLLLPKSFIFQ